MISIGRRSKPFLSTIFVFGLIVSVLLPLFALAVSANEIQISEENDELVGISTKADDFYYNDKMLLGNIGSTSASGEIALASIGLAEAAYDETQISFALDQMGFSTLYTSDYYFQNTTRDDNNVVAYSIAEKYVNYYGELYRLIVVPIRGTPETCEWYSNLNIGSDETHRGFNLAAWKVLGKLSEFLYEPSYDVQHTVIWTMGHSRGAAVANIIAGEISTGNAFSDVLSRDYVFGYTFACPAVSTKADTSLHNIFNYNNGGDIVPALPLSAWGFKRYGQTIELPASDYDNLCQRYKAETGEEYQVGMTTVDWEAVLENIAETREEFVRDEKIQLGVDILAWFVGGNKDPNFSLLDVVLSHPCADAEIVGGVIKTTLFPKSTLEAMTLDLAVADFQLMLDTDLQAYLDLENDLITAINDTAEMCDVDSEDEETHNKYLEWTAWLSSHYWLIYSAEDMVNVAIESKADLRIAYTAAGERYVDYKDIASTIRDLISLLYDTEGNLVAPFTQGHPQQTYLWWVNSFYYGYKGWYENSDITMVNWKGRNQRTYVGDSCFENCDNLQIVSEVPNKMYIGIGAFYECSNLTNVEISGDGITIGPSAFYECGSLADVELVGDGITIGEYAFAYCQSITELTIPDSIKKVGVWAFADCGIKHLTTPFGDDYYDWRNTGYSDNVFSHCPITDLTITKGRDGEYYDYPGEASYTDSDRIWPADGIVRVKVEEGIKSIGSYMFASAHRYYSLKEIELPSTLERISGSAFYSSLRTMEKVTYHGDIASWCGIEFQDFYSNPIEAGNGEFYIDGEKITNLVIPDGVKEVKGYAFYKCTTLESVTIPKSVNAIGYAAFYECKNITSLKVNGAVEIGPSAFFECSNLADVELVGDGITIGEYAFAYCQSITELTIPDSINKVEGWAFYDCGIKHLTTPFGDDYYDWRDIGYNVTVTVFGQCPITDLTITKGRDGEYYDYPGEASYPDSDRIWPADSIEHVKIEEGVKSIGSHMFSSEHRYYSLKEIDLPSTLERINESAFYSYEGKVEKVIYHGDIASWCGIEFHYEYSNPLAVGNGELYIDGEKLTTLVIPEGVKEVKEYAFYNCSTLESVTIPKSVNAIGYDAFYECIGIKDVYYPGTKTEWNKINILSGNDPLLSAEIHYLSHIHNLKKTKGVKATCLTEGNSTYWTCDICGKFFADESAESEIEKDSWIIPATGHAFGEWKTVREATEIEAGLETRICENDTTHVEFREIPKISRINISNALVTLSAYSYTYSGGEQKPTVTVKNGSITLSLGTDYSVGYADNINAGTATVLVEGIGNYKGEKTVTFTIMKADAKLTFAKSAITKKTTDAAFTNNLAKTTDGTVKFKSSNTNVATVNSTSGLVTIKGAGTVTITATAAEGKNYKTGSTAYSLVVEAPEPTVSGFSDVQDPSHPYYNAIYWAAGKGITKGYSDGTFGIDRSCTRGEMMMFLWRYAGKPAPKNVSKSPFKDVPKTHTFYKAILWGSQKGITKGYSDGTFGINRNVSRGECMMFLWRLKGKPAPKAVAKAPFSDVPKSHVFYKAVLWGYQKKITTGFTSGKLKGKFGVNENCSRGQIVTFLYRAK